MSDQDVLASAKGRELLHKIWRDVGDNFHDASRLAHWSSLEHRFDNEITDRPSMLRCIDDMLASLGDSYTRRLSDEELVERRRLRSGQQPSVTWRQLPNNLGYVRIAGFDALNIPDQLELALKNVDACQALIVDLRGNGGGLLNETVNCCELVVESGPVCTMEYRSQHGMKKHEVGFSDDAFLLLVTAADGQETVDAYKRRKCLLKKRPVVLLIDEDTASSAELFASAMLVNGEHGQVIAIGKRSHGKGIGQDLIAYEEGVSVKVSDVRFYGADDQWFGDCGQSTKNGIIPAKEAEGFQNQMDAAVRHLTGLLTLPAATNYHSIKP